MPDAQERSIVLTRQIDAEPAMVWCAWSEPALIRQWFGPDCFEVLDTALDLRPGGRWRLVLRGKDGGAFDGQAFEQSYDISAVVPGRRIEMHERWPDLAFRVTSEVEAKDGGALVTFRADFASAADRETARQRGVEAGANASLDKLKALAESRPAAAEIRFTRHIAGATPQRLYRAWTEAAEIKQWWGPHGMTMPACEIELRPGGRFHALMRDSQGTEYPITCTLRAAEAPSGAAPGRVVMAMPFGAGEATCATTFAAEGEGTRVTSHWRHADAKDRAAHEAMGFDQGWDQMFKRLQAHVLGAGAIKTLRIERRLAAPRSLVWRAFTDPARLALWWGPAGFTNPTCRFEARPEGRIYIVMRAPDGSDHPMRGRVLEVKEPERLGFLAQPLDGEGRAYAETLTVVTLREEDGATLLTIEAHTVALTTDTIEALKGEMEAGWRQSLDRLAATLAA